MSVPAAYLGVILIWSTTPLAIQWSGDEVGFLFGVTARMVLGAIVSLCMVGLFNIRLPWHKAALHTYLAAGLGIFGAMLSVYWASRFIPSGWISVLYGLAPIITGLMATVWLGETLTLARLAGMFIGLGGLAMIFMGGQSLGPNAVYGVVGVLLSVTLHTTSAVTIKRIGAVMHPLATTTGGLLIAAPLFVLVYKASGGQLPETVPQRVFAAIIYLGVAGSVLGFALYYYVLHHVEATRVALLALVAPVLALMIGNVFNNEVFDPRIIYGAAMILSGLLIYEYGQVFIRQLVKGRAGAGDPAT